MELGYFKIKLVNIDSIPEILGKSSSILFEPKYAFFIDLLKTHKYIASKKSTNTIEILIYNGSSDYIRYIISGDPYASRITSDNIINFYDESVMCNMILSNGTLVDPIPKGLYDDKNVES